MTINRTQNAAGEWEYADEDEGWFIFWVKPDYDVESMDNFIEGRQKAIRHDAHSDRVEGENVILSDEVITHLLEIRARAYSAYKTGNGGLMFEALGRLEAECNWRGLAFAARSEVKFAEKTREAKSKAGIAGRSMKIDGENLNPKSIIERLAINRDELALCWTPADELWEPFKAAIEECFWVTEKTERTLLTRRGKNSLEDRRYIEIRLHEDGEMKRYSYTQFRDNLRDARKKLTL